MQQTRLLTEEERKLVVEWFDQRWSNLPKAVTDGQDSDAEERLEEAFVAVWDGYTTIPFGDEYHGIVISVIWHPDTLYSPHSDVLVLIDGKIQPLESDSFFDVNPLDY